MIERKKLVHFSIKRSQSDEVFLSRCSIKWNMEAGGKLRSDSKACISSSLQASPSSPAAFQINSKT